MKTDCVARFRLDKCTGALAIHLVGHRHDADILHFGVGKDEVLDFFGADLLTATIDHILLTSLGIYVAADLSHHGAHAIEAVGGEAFGIRIGIVVIAADGVGAATNQFARLPVRHFASGIVDSPKL